MQEIPTHDTAAEQASDREEVDQQAVYFQRVRELVSEFAVKNPQYASGEPKQPQQMGKIMQYVIDHASGEWNFLIQNNLGLVQSFVQKYSSAKGGVLSRGVDPRDLFQSGVFGLMTYESYYRV